eukprot:766957-Hanusia_phi.AAC.7
MHLPGLIHETTVEEEDPDEEELTDVRPFDTVGYQRESRPVIQEEDFDDVDAQNNSTLVSAFENELESSGVDTLGLDESPSYSLAIQELEVEGEDDLAASASFARAPSLKQAAADLSLVPEMKVEEEEIEEYPMDYAVHVAADQSPEARHDFAEDGAEGNDGDSGFASARADAAEVDAAPRQEEARSLSIPSIADELLNDKEHVSMLEEHSEPQRSDHSGPDEEFSSLHITMAPAPVVLGVPGMVETDPGEGDGEQQQQQQQQQQQEEQQLSARSGRGLLEASQMFSDVDRSRGMLDIIVGEMEQTEAQATLNSERKETLRPFSAGSSRAKMPRIQQSRPSSARSRALQEEEDGNFASASSILFEKQSMQALGSSAAQGSDEIVEERRVEAIGEDEDEYVGHATSLRVAACGDQLLFRTKMSFASSED